jgi:hypothetical protein
VRLLLAFQQIPSLGARKPSGPSLARDFDVGAAGCSTLNGLQILEVLLRTLAILELHKRELRTQDKTYIDNPHRHGSEVSRYSVRCKRDWVFPRISLKIC